LQNFSDINPEWGEKLPIAWKNRLERMSRLAFNFDLISNVHRAFNSATLTRKLDEM